MKYITSLVKSSYAFYVIGYHRQIYPERLRVQKRNVSYRICSIDVALVTDKQRDTLDVTSDRSRQQWRHSFLHIISTARSSQPQQPSRYLLHGKVNRI